MRKSKNLNALLEKASTIDKRQDKEREQLCAAMSGFYGSLGRRKTEDTLSNRDILRIECIPSTKTTRERSTSARN